MPLNDVYHEIEPWACEAGCQWLCEIVSLEYNQEFLRLRYKCPTCSAQATRYYDPKNHGYVEAMGVRCENSINEHHFLESRLCAGTMYCPRSEFKRFFRRGIELEDCIDEIAKIVPEQCSGLSERELGYCFQKLFDINTHGWLQGRFREVYHREGDPSAERAPNAPSMASTTLFQIEIDEEKAHPGRAVTPERKIL